MDWELVKGGKKPPRTIASRKGKLPYQGSGEGKGRPSDTEQVHPRGEQEMAITTNSPIPETKSSRTGTEERGLQFRGDSPPLLRNWKRTSEDCELDRETSRTNGKSNRERSALPLKPSSSTEQPEEKADFKVR